MKMLKIAGETLALAALWGTLWAWWVVGSTPQMHPTTSVAAKITTGHYVLVADARLTSAAPNR